MSRDLLDAAAAAVSTSRKESTRPSADAYPEILAGAASLRSYAGLLIAAGVLAAVACIVGGLLMDNKTPLGMAGGAVVGGVVFAVFYGLAIAAKLAALALLQRDRAMRATRS